MYNNRACSYSKVTDVPTTDYSSKKFNLTEVLDEFVSQSVQDCPSLKDTFLLYSAPTNSWHGNFKSESAINTAAQFLMRQNATPVENAAVMHPNVIPELHLMAWLGDPVLQNLTLGTVHLSCLHELGHLVAPAAALIRNNSQNFGECVADSFSLIRLQKLHPGMGNAQLIGKMVGNSAMQLILLQDAGHFTTPVLSALQDIMKNHDLNKLTTAQAANCAYRLTLQYSCNERDMVGALKAFEPVAQLFTTMMTSARTSGIDLTEELFKKCAEITLQDHGEITPLVYISGKAVLDNIMNAHPSFMGRPMAPLEGPFWDSVRKQMKARDAEIRVSSAQTFIRKVDHLQALGYFDKDQHPDKMIDPAAYESKENQDYIRARRAIYIEQALNSKKSSVISSLSL